MGEKCIFVNPPPFKIFSATDWQISLLILTRDWGNSLLLPCFQQKIFEIFIFDRMTYSTIFSRDWMTILLYLPMTFSRISRFFSRNRTTNGRFFPETHRWISKFCSTSDCLISPFDFATYWRNLRFLFIASDWKFLVIFSRLAGGFRYFPMTDWWISPFFLVIVWRISRNLPWTFDKFRDIFSWLIGYFCDISLWPIDAFRNIFQWQTDKFRNIYSWPFDELRDIFPWPIDKFLCTFS